MTHTPRHSRLHHRLTLFVVTALIDYFPGRFEFRRTITQREFDGSLDIYSDQLRADAFEKRVTLNIMHLEES
ncbi:hypothetical protein [Nitrosomonas sp. Is37]|uniref:hypothetical protein n=1 Tax=Nitrosomonas sp. Is37 TaxID=3080535 RepID=UPI00294B89F5|nr:hypothetical protein [Nitrosomonas sp. Is37]MDV6343795.1 hypothetical protein [Nitrosomonas sp. Is37]